MGNYIITFDADDTLNLSHAAFNRGTSGSGWNSHRYIAKAQTPSGTRYFYTPQQVRAYQQGGRKQTSDNSVQTKTINNTKSTVSEQKFGTGRKKNVTGTAKPGSIGRRQALNSSKPAGNTPLMSEAQVAQERRRSAYNSMVKSGQSKKAKEYGEAANALSDYKKAQFNSKAALSQTKDSVKDLAIDAKYKMISKLYKKLGANTTQLDNQIAFDTAQNKRYFNENAKASAKAIGKQAKAAGKFAKEFGDYAKIVGKEKAEEKKKAAKEKANAAVEDTKRSVKRATGLEAREKAKNAKTDGKQYGAYNTLEEMEYYRTPAGKVEKAYNKAKNRAKYNRVTAAVKKAKNATNITVNKDTKSERIKKEYRKNSRDKSKGLKVTTRDKNGNVTNVYEGKEARKYMRKQLAQVPRAIAEQRKIRR